MRWRIEAAMVVLACLVAVAVYFEWRAGRHAQQALELQLNIAKQQLSDAETRQQTRDENLKTALARLHRQKALVQKPVQVVRELPSILPLPQPIVIEQAESGHQPPSQTPGLVGSVRKNPKSSPLDANIPDAKLPSQDLKPLYDFAVDCQECRERLQAAQGDLADERKKTEVLGRERDSALRVARGGSALQKIARAAKWFAIGAAAGFVAAKVAR